MGALALLRGFGGGGPCVGVAEVREDSPLILLSRGLSDRWTSKGYGYRSRVSGLDRPAAQPRTPNT